MADATVFVDDAVLGRLPRICVKDGTPTDDTLTLHSPVADRDGLGIAWLLLLAGPLGWLGLIIVASRGSAETLTVRLPFSLTAFNRLRRAKRASWIFGVMAVALVLAVWVAAGDQQWALSATLGAVWCFAVIQWVRSLVRIRADSVVVTLDASRRWVTLSRVHPSFTRSLHPDSAVPQQR